MTQTYEAWRITYQSSEQAARAAFERMMELEQGKCLHQIAEPAAQSEGEAFQALSELTNALRERHYGRMPAEVQAAYDKAWTIVFTGEKSAPAAPQAVQPAVPVICESRQQLEAMVDASMSELATVAPLLTRSECKRLILAALSAHAHPADGVPAQAVGEMTAERASYFMRRFLKEEKLLGPNEQAALHYVISLLVATQPAAQGLHSQSEWEEMHTLPTCDDLIWLYCQDTNTIDGPIAPDPSLEQYGWTHWAYANAPSTAGIDAAQAKQGGAA